MRNIVGQDLKQALNVKGMSQKDLADSLYVTPQAVSKWVNGECRPDSDNISKINELLGIDLMKAVSKENRIKTHHNYDNSKNYSLSNIDSFEKAKLIAKEIINESGMCEVYSKPVLRLIEWLLPAVIGLTYHEYIHKKFDDIDFYNVCYYLDDYFDTNIKKVPDLYNNRLEYSFYLMGMDLFELSDYDELEKDEYCSESMNEWYKFNKATSNGKSSNMFFELSIAIVDLVDYIEGIL